MHGLGELEAAVMDVLWRATDTMKVRDVLSELDKELAYTTVMTVLDNLHRKEWVRRELDGKAYRYRPRLSRAEAASNALRQVLSASGDPEGVLLHFARSASERETELLRGALPRRRRK